MKQVVVACVLMLSGAVQAGLPVVLARGRVDVVAAPDASAVTRFAAEELATNLSRVFGEKVPLKTEPEEGRTAVCVGVNGWSRAEGIDVGKLPRDAFTVCAGNGRICISGRDDPSDVRATKSFLGSEARWIVSGERASLFGVYAFLERQIGMRFYFPGELGTIAPRTDRIEVPEGRWTSAPSFTVRRYGYSDGSVSPELLAEFGGDAIAFKRANFERLRMETEYIPCCHGLNKFHYMSRFGKEHPDYFALKPNGSRDNNPGGLGHVGHICYSSPIMEELYLDVKAYLTGQDPKTRGLDGWGRNVQGRYVDVMSQDSLFPCGCTNCQAQYDFSMGANYATEFIWRKTVDLAERLKREGIDGVLTQMAYCPYRAVPKGVEIPDNIAVMVAELGPWTLRNVVKDKMDRDEIRAWKAKLGRPVWLWTYPYKTELFRDVPQMAPRTWGRYYQSVAPDVFGAFAESESDKWIYNYLNYYVFSRVAWDASADVDRIVDEHHRLMFGAAAEEMKRFYDELESVWMERVNGKFAETARGPMVVPPDAETLWNDCYSETRLKGWGSLLAQAAERIAAGTLEARRVDFFRREFLEPLVARRQEYLARAGKLAKLALPTDGETRVTLRPFTFKGRRADPKIHTEVSARREEGALVLRFDLDEPHLAARALSDPGVAETMRTADDGVEFFLVPDFAHRRGIHIFVNARGEVADAACAWNGTKISDDWSWDGNITATTEERPGGYVIEARIPLAALGRPSGPIRMNLCRNRTLNGIAGTGLYTWGPYVVGYADLDNYGRLELTEGKR